jgi:hypothetical protein
MVRLGNGALGFLRVVLLVAMITVGVTPAARAQEPESRWARGVFGIPGVDSRVHAVVQWDDGRGPAIYAGGLFEIAGTTRAAGIARWDGQGWSTLGERPDEGVQSADAPEGGVYAIQPFDDGTGPGLYVAGAFETAGGQPAMNIARWDGQVWASVGDGLGTQGDRVTSLAVFDDGSGPALYAALNTDRGTLCDIVRWDGVAWTTVAGRILGRFEVLQAVDLGQGSVLIAGGLFDFIGGVGAQAIAQWDGRQWSAFGIGLANAVEAVAVFDDGSGPALYAAGDIARSGTTPIFGVARWNEDSWEPVGDLSRGDGLSLHVFDAGEESALYAGGVNLTAGDLPPRGLLKWDGRAWSLPGGDQIGSWTFDMATFERGDHRELIAAGWVFLDEAQRAANIARFVDGDWRTLGAHLGALGSLGDHRAVFALERFDDGTGESLYVGGQFGIDTGSGTEPDAFQLARWNEVGWSDVGGGVAPGWPEALVSTLKASDFTGTSELYVGGNFTIAGQVAANAIASWDGRRWATLGDGLTGGASPAAYAIEMLDLGAGPALYVGGAFTVAGSVPASGVAVWDGVGWSAIGQEIAGPVYALALFDDGTGPALFAGGNFSLAGEPDAGDLARWNGERWEPAGMSARGSGFVRTLAVIDIGDGPALFAGGRLEVASRTEPAWIARWNGNDWEDVGTNGPNYVVRDIDAVDFGSGAELVAAGGFFVGEGPRSYGIARWDGSSWRGFDTGLGLDPATHRRDARAVKTFDDGSGPAMFVGGEFLFAGGHVSPGIARWSLPSCPADLDLDGALTIFDFLQFQNLFDAGEPRADFDGDGSLTLFDFLAFQNEFDAGC